MSEKMMKAIFEYITTGKGPEGFTLEVPDHAGKYLKLRKNPFKLFRTIYTGFWCIGDVFMMGNPSFIKGYYEREHRRLFKWTWYGLVRHVPHNKPFKEYKLKELVKLSKYFDIYASFGIPPKNKEVCLNPTLHLERYGLPENYKEIYKDDFVLSAYSKDGEFVGSAEDVYNLKFLGIELDDD